MRWGGAGKLEAAELVRGEGGGGRAGGRAGGVGLDQNSSLLTPELGSKEALCHSLSSRMPLRVVSDDTFKEKGAIPETAERDG